MTDILHVGDVGSVIYIDVQESGISLDTDLSDFTTREVHLRRANTLDVVVISAVPVAVDPADSVSKLKIVTGTETGLALTGVGEFILPSTCKGSWVAEVKLADAEWTGTGDAFDIFELRGNL